MKKLGTGSVFRRMFALFLLVVLVIYLVVAGLFVQYVNRERAIEENNLKSRVASSTRLIEEQIRSVANVQFQLFSDPRVAQVAHGLYSDDYERSQVILDLISYIQSTQRINSIIEDIILTFPLESIELSASDGYDRKIYTPPKESRTNHNQLILQDDALELVIAYPLEMSLDANYIPDFMIRIVLSRDHLQSTIAPFRGNEHEGAFWIYRFEDQDTVLYDDSPLNTAVHESWEGAWLEAKKPQAYSDSIRSDGTEYFVSSAQIPDYNLLLVTYQDSDAMAWTMGNTLLNMAVIFLAMGVMFLMLILWANKSVSKPIYRIIEALETVRSGHETVRIYHHKKDEFGFIYDSFNHMVDRIEELIENVREKEALRQRAEMIQLQSQINPHFLYNSFYNIKFLAHNEEYEQIETLVTALAKYYRFLNKETDQVIALSGEVAHMENYIEIQQMRFGDMISVDIGKLPGELASFRVPKLILQPIVENAYNYGLRNTLEGGLLAVSYHQEGTQLYIDIEDNGGAMTEEKAAQISRQMNDFSGEALNHALTNIQRRLRLYYGENSGIELSVGGKKGLLVRVILDTDVRL